MFNHQRASFVGLASILLLACGGGDETAAGTGGASVAGKAGAANAGGKAGNGATAIGGKSISNGGAAIGAGVSNASLGGAALGGLPGTAGASTTGGVTTAGTSSATGGVTTAGTSFATGGATAAGTSSVTAGTPGAAGGWSVAGTAGIAGGANVAAYTVSATVSNLLGAGLVLRLNPATDTLVPPSGNVTFGASMAQGDTYTVTVNTQPSNPTQLCLIKDATGTIATSNVNVNVDCSKVPRYYLVVDGVDNSVSTYVIDANSGRSTYIGKVATGAAPTAIAVDPTGTHAYVTNAGDDSISQYVIGGDGKLTAQTALTLTKDTKPRSVAIDSDGKNAYVLNGNETLAQYSIDKLSGALSSSSLAALPTGGQPANLVVDPSGTYVYVTNSGAIGTVSQYKVGSSGVLQGGAAPVAAGANPVSIAVDPSGKYAYVTNSGDSSVSEYFVDATGALQALSPKSVSTGAKPTSVVVDPTGKFAFVANGDGTSVSQFRIDSSSGKLGTVAVASVATEVAPTSVGIDPTGRFVYVANATGDSVTQYIIGSDGILAANAPPRLTAQGKPVAVAMVPGTDIVHPYGKNVYVTNDNNSLSLYSIASSDGTLTALTPMTVAGMGPVAIVVDPTASHAYVVNSNKNTVAQYAIGGNGTLTAIGVTSPVTGNLPWGIAVHPSNRFAYVSSKLDRSVFQYVVNADGSLAPMTPASISVTSVGSPSAIRVDPSGRFAYVAISDGNIARFKIAAGGELDAVTATSILAGSQPASLGIGPSGTHLYSANSLSDDVSQYRIAADLSADGALSALSTNKVTAGSVPYFVALDPSGSFVYVANSGSGSISQYLVNSTDADMTKHGTLTALAPSPVGVGTNGEGSPFSIAIDPSGRYVYVVDSRAVGGAVWRYLATGSGTSRGVLVSPVSAPSGASGRSIALTNGYQ